MSHSSLSSCFRPRPRPSVTLKVATSLDGKIALANGQSEWITGEAARAYGRKLRGQHDAVAIGANTAQLDNPQLTTRIDGQPDPIRVIYDSRARLSHESNLAKTARDIPVWLMCSSHQDTSYNLLKNMGVTLLSVSHNNGLDIHESLAVLKARAVGSLLVEGGGTLAASFIKAGVIDRIDWFRAPIILGGEGRNAVGDLGLEDLNLAYHFARVDVRELELDLYERYERVS